MEDVPRELCSEADQRRLPRRRGSDDNAEPPHLHALEHVLQRREQALQQLHAPRLRPGQRRPARDRRVPHLHPLVADAEVRPLGGRQWCCHCRVVQLPQPRPVPCSAQPVRVHKLCEQRRVCRRHFTAISITSTSTTTAAGRGCHELAPAEDVAEVELPRRTLAGKGGGGGSGLLDNSGVEGDHLLEEPGGDGGEEARGDHEEVVVLELVDVDLREAAEERLGQPLAPTALLRRVLRRKDPELFGALERPPQLGNERLPAVVQHAVQALQHRLRREVQLVQ